MPRQSAGILLFRSSNGLIEVFLVHHGGPYWANRDDGAWSIPKGEINAGEDPLDAARREFQEETGFEVQGAALLLRPVKQAGGKIVHAWAVRGDANPAAVKSNYYSVMWPPKSGRLRSYPEVDRAGWFGLEEARQKLIKGQLPLIEELEEMISAQA